MSAEIFLSDHSRTSRILSSALAARETDVFKAVESVPVDLLMERSAEDILESVWNLEPAKGREQMGRLRPEHVVLQRELFDQDLALRGDDLRGINFEEYHPVQRWRVKWTAFWQQDLRALWPDQAAEVAAHVRFASERWGAADDQMEVQRDDFARNGYGRPERTR